MTFQSLLIANRGEIAVRVARACAERGLHSVAVYAADDAESLHRRFVDRSVPLRGAGARAYLDAEHIVEVAVEQGCDALHPGYGFLSESPTLARLCQEAGITFVGPRPEVLALFGDKLAARAEAQRAEVPVPRGLLGTVSTEEASEFLSTLGPGAAVMVKAVSGGGGRGTRMVADPEDMEQAIRAARKEAQVAFGSDLLYVEECIPSASHIEVQIIADAAGSVMQIGERDCSLQRRRQKVLEIAPGPWLDPTVREEIHLAATRLATATGYTNIGTFEFLVPNSEGKADPGSDPANFSSPFVFIEANPRLQVEHTVTEAVTGLDLVSLQISLAEGATLQELDLHPGAPPASRGVAIQARVNLESLQPDGSVLPSAKPIEAYQPPGGPHVRVDGAGYTGYRPSAAYDSLLAKVIVWGKDLSTAAGHLTRALQEFRLQGPANNLGVLGAILNEPAFLAGEADTTWLDRHAVELARRQSDADPYPGDAQPQAPGGAAAVSSRRAAGGQTDVDPLALFEHTGQGVEAAASTPSETRPQRANEGAHEPLDGQELLPSPIQGTVVEVSVRSGEQVRSGQTVAVIEAMKMEHPVISPLSGEISALHVEIGELIDQGEAVATLITDDAGQAESEGPAQAVDLDQVRPDLEELFERRALTLDEARPEAMAKRHARGYLSPRENIARLVDPGSFKEHWALLVARQHHRRSLEELRRETPADGLVAGTALINGAHFDDQRARAMVVSYDYTVLAGTQGSRNHYKQDRIYELTNRLRLPLVLFAEGGGGRPGDDNNGPRVPIDTYTFTQFSRLSGLVPLVGVANGRCFAGNTALLACCDVIIATEPSTVAMGGPAMIEGGGLGVYLPEDVGPMSFQVPNGVVDILVPDEAAAVDTARQYLSYFQGSISSWEAGDARHLRHAVPANRKQVYDMRALIQGLVDEKSVLELRPSFGRAVITAFARIEGVPVGVLANNPQYQAGAIDSDAADKTARFLQLCDAFDLPVVSLVDCPGMMVGPDAERQALVRHCVRTFNAGANLTTPMFVVVVRKAYGLGAQAMCGGSSRTGAFTVAWPTAEFAGMNIEGSVKLGYRKELAAITDVVERRAVFDQMVAKAYDEAKAVNAAAGGGVDEVIDPAETREWIVAGLRRLPPTTPRTTKKYPYVDTW